MKTNSSVKALGKGKFVSYPCRIEHTLVPQEVEATLEFGGKKVFVLAPMTTVNVEKNSIKLFILDESRDHWLVGVTGQVENGTSTIKVKKSDFKP